jgi:NADH-quinone oxidoreductase subunit J
VLLLVLIVCAGIGTLLLLPSRREAATRAIGGAIALFAFLIAGAMLLRSYAPVGAYFWIFSAIAIVSAVRVATHRRPVYSALYFVLAVLASAGLFVLLWADFMAAALVLIYAGAILVTYVFVIMLAAQAGGQGELTDADTLSNEPVVATAIGFGMMAVLLLVIYDKGAAIATREGALTVAHGNSVRALARYLFEYQLVNLELAGLILTMAVVGAIVIARRYVAGVALPPAPPVLGDDDPHSIPVEGTSDPRQKQYPET